MSVTIAALADRALRRLGIVVVAVGDRPPFAATVPATQIATNALLWLGIIAPEDDLTDPDRAPDQAFALAKVLAIHDALIAQGIVSWAVGAIPLAVSEEYTMLVAQHLGPAFGKPVGDAAGQAAVEARIRKVAMILDAPTLAAQAVLSVHQDLAARGKVRWSVFDIPSAVEDPYTYLGAYQLAPLFGQKGNDADVMEANQSLARYIALPSSGEPVVAEYF